jgi:hypothetical protein
VSREIRSRRAGLSRDESRQQPLYSRLLGLQYVTPNGFLCFVFFEGAVALGILLALAELVSWWGVLVLPITVAVMVKLNDVVAGAVIQTPSHPSRASRNAASRGAASRAAASRMSTASATSVPGELSFSAVRGEPATRTMPAAVPAVRRAAVRPATAPASGYSPAGHPASEHVSSAYPTSAFPAGGYAADGVGGVGSAIRDIRAADTADAGADAFRAVDAAPPAVRAGHMSSTGARASGAGGLPATDAVLDVSPLNGPPVATHWEAPTERLDSPLRWARQAASRRYE